MTRYVGRFAPSPSGALHAGSVVAALASWLRARQQHGRWLLRIEDIDPLREQPGATAAIQQELLRIGLHWDGEVRLQSTGVGRHRAVLQQLVDQDRAYPCACTRSKIAAQGGHPERCRVPQTVAQPRAWRFHPVQPQMGFRDQVLGWQARDATDRDHPLIWRVDDWPAYQLAVVVDDHDAGVSEVVRGADLLESTPRQLDLYAALGWAPPDHLHVPLVTDGAGHKLSKQTHAPPIAAQDPIDVLQSAWQHLRQPDFRSHRSHWTVTDWLACATRCMSFERLVPT